MSGNNEMKGRFLHDEQHGQTAASSYCGVIGARNNSQNVQINTENCKTSISSLTADEMDIIVAFLYAEKAIMSAVPRPREGNPITKGHKEMEMLRKGWKDCNSTRRGGADTLSYTQRANRGSTGEEMSHFENEALRTRRLFKEKRTYVSTRREHSSTTHQTLVDALSLKENTTERYERERNHQVDFTTHVEREMAMRNQKEMSTKLTRARIGENSSVIETFKQIQENESTLRVQAMLLGEKEMVMCNQKETSTKLTRARTGENPSVIETSLKRATQFGEREIIVDQKEMSVKQPHQRMDSLPVIQQSYVRKKQNKIQQEMPEPRGHREMFICNQKELPTKEIYPRNAGTLSLTRTSKEIKEEKSVHGAEGFTLIKREKRHRVGNEWLQHDKPKRTKFEDQSLSHGKKDLSFIQYDATAEEEVIEKRTTLMNGISGHVNHNSFQHLEEEKLVIEYQQPAHKMSMKNDNRNTTNSQPFQMDEKRLSLMSVHAREQCAQKTTTTGHHREQKIQKLRLAIKEQEQTLQKLKKSSDITTRQESCQDNEHVTSHAHRCADKRTGGREIVTWSDNDSDSGISCA